MRPLNTGIAPPPLPRPRDTRDLVQQRFKRREQPSNAGASSYAYLTFGAQLHSLVGRGTGLKTGAPLGYGQSPMVVMPTLRREGVAFVAGQFAFSPLSEGEK